MKNFLFILLLTSGVYAQQVVFNVQHYCIDVKPFKNGACDISGNEYSFVFLDSQKKDVTLFLTNTKLKYKITESHLEQANHDFTWYNLINENGITEMRINKQKTKIEFIDATNHIYLNVGKSTKSE